MTFVWFFAIVTCCPWLFGSPPPNLVKCSQTFDVSSFILLGSGCDFVGRVGSSGIIIRSVSVGGFGSFGLGFDVASI
jgi:hypothetical protein